MFVIQILVIENIYFLFNEIYFIFGLFFYLYTYT